LVLVQLAAFGTLLRSVALDRWISVAVSVLLIGAALAAQRGRTWGVALSFALGATFFGVWALGIAPLFFAFVGVLAMLPFGRLYRHFAGFDRGAAAVLAVAASSAGLVSAVAWKAWALDLFRALPLLTPSLYPHHGIVVLAMLAVGTVLFRRANAATPNLAFAAEGASGSLEEARVRVAPALRVDDNDSEEALETDDVRSESARMRAGE
jgi:hypothetical protein